MRSKSEQLFESIKSMIFDNKEDEAEYCKLNDPAVTTSISECWVLLLLGSYAISKMISMQGNEATRDNITLNSFCWDRRRVSTVRKVLEERNLIVPSYNNRETFEYVESEIEKLLVGSYLEPKFKVEGTIAKGESYNIAKNTPITDMLTRYLPVKNLKALSAIYIYLNQDKYDFKLVKEVSLTGRLYYSQVKEVLRYNLLVYPKDLIDVLDTSIVNANKHEYAINNAREILTETFNFPFKTIKDDTPFLTYKEVQDNLTEVQDKISHLQKVEKELAYLEKEYSKRGEKETVDTINKAIDEYTTLQAPIWINEEGLKKTIALMIFKGVPAVTEIDRRGKTGRW